MGKIPFGAAAPRLLILLWIAALIPGAGAQPATRYYIAFSAGAGDGEDIYVIREDGQNRTNLTNNPGRDYHADWSPDGRRIVFTSTRDGNPEIYVMSSSGDNLANLTDSPSSDSAPDWSPDGRHIAFASDRDGGQDIYTLSLDTLEVQRVTYDGVEKSAPAWFPDNQQIAYWTRVDGVPKIFSVNVENGTRTQLTLAAETSWPAIDNSGTWLAYEQTVSGLKKVMIQPLEDGATSMPLPASEDGFNYAFPAWSPDGERLAMVSDRDGGADIYIVSRSGGSFLPLTQDSAPEVAPAWQPVLAPVDIAEAVPEGDFSLGQSFLNVEDVDPEDVVLLGRSTAQLVPEPPYVIGPDDLLVIRMEVTINPDGTVNVTPTPGDPNNTAAVSLDAFTYMSAELRGVDLNRFDIYPEPDARYMKRLSADTVNFWEWELRPRPSAVGQLSFLSVKFFVPERLEDGTVAYREGEGVLRFEIDVRPEITSVSATTTRVPEQGMRLTFNSGDSLLLSLLRPNLVDFVRVSSVNGEGWFDVDFGLGGVELPTGTCLVYHREGANFSAPADCAAIYDIDIPYSSVFWYDFALGAPYEVQIAVGGSPYRCVLSSASCDF